MALSTLVYLEQRLAALERELKEALRHSSTDDFAVAELQYRKSIVADEIQHNRWLVQRFRKLGA